MKNLIALSLFAGIIAVAATGCGDAPSKPGTTVKSTEKAGAPAGAPAAAPGGAAPAGPGGGAEKK